MQKAVFVFTIVFLSASPVYALSIKNLSGQTQTMTLEQSGAQRQLIIIPKSQTRYLEGGNMTVTLPNQTPVDAKFDEEYIIWPNGKMMIQRRLKNNGGSL